MPNPFLVDEQQDWGQAQATPSSFLNPQGNQQGQALAQALQSGVRVNQLQQLQQQSQELRNLQPPNLSDKTQQQPGAVKSYFMGFIDQIGRNLASRPTAYQEWLNKQQLEQKDRQLQQFDTVPFQMPDGSIVPVQRRDMGSVAGRIGSSANRLEGTMATVNQKLADSGYEMVADGQGGWKQQPIPMERLSEKAKSGIALASARSEYQQAVAAKAKADADVKMNPNNPTFLQNQKKIDAQLAMAQQKITLAVMGNQRQDAQFQINNGVTPTGAPAEIQGAGQMLDDAGNPIGKNFQNLNAPTAATKNMGQMATTVIPHLDHMAQTVDANAEDMGPIMGRWSTALVNGIKSTGDDAKDKRLNSMLTEMKLLTSAVARTHFGGRTGPQAAAYFTGLLDAAKTPAGIKGVLEAVRPYMTGYQEMGTAKTNANSGKAKFDFNKFPKAQP